MKKLMILTGWPPRAHMSVLNAIIRAWAFGSINQIVSAILQLVNSIKFEEFGGVVGTLDLEIESKPSCSVKLFSDDSKEITKNVKDWKLGKQSCPS